MEIVLWIYSAFLVVGILGGVAATIFWLAVNLDRILLQLIFGFPIVYGASLFGFMLSQSAGIYRSIGLVMVTTVGICFLGIFSIVIAMASDNLDHALHSPKRSLAVLAVLVASLLSTSSVATASGLAKAMIHATGIGSYTPGQMLEGQADRKIKRKEQSLRDSIGACKTLLLAIEGVVADKLVFKNSGWIRTKGDIHLRSGNEQLTAAYWVQVIVGDRFAIEAPWLRYEDRMARTCSVRIAAAKYEPNGMMSLEKKLVSKSLRAFLRIQNSRLFEASPKPTIFIEHAFAATMSTLPFAEYEFKPDEETETINAVINWITYLALAFVSIVSVLYRRRAHSN